MTPDSSLRSKVFDREQREPQEAVLGALDEGHGHALADLAGVVQTEPLMGEVAATVHHELGTEDSTERPAGDQRRHERVREARRANSRATIDAAGRGRPGAPGAMPPKLASPPCHTAIHRAGWSA